MYMRDMREREITNLHRSLLCEASKLREKKQAMGSQTSTLTYLVNSGLRATNRSLRPHLWV